MYSPAYLGDALCKKQVLERLQLLQRAGNWEMRPIYWNGKQGSLVGSLLHGENLDEWERLFGLPKWLALAIDTVLPAGPDVGTAVGFGISLLDAIPVGADLRTAGSELLLELLEGTQDGLLTLVSAASVAEPLRSVASLHRRVVDGINVPAADWRAVRRHAVAQTDAAKQDALESNVGACVEAAAWDPRSSRTAVSDTVRSWLRVTSDAAIARQSSWNGDDDNRIKALGDRLLAEAREAAGNDKTFIDVFKLLEQKHPDEATKLKAYVAVQRKCHTEQWHQVTRLLTRVIVASRGAAHAA